MQSFPDRNHSAGPVFVPGYTLGTGFRQGTYGKVYMGVVNDSTRRVAVKVQQVETDCGTCGKVIRELDIGSRMQHPNILSPTGVGTCHGYVWQAFPWIHETLRTWISYAGESERLTAFASVVFQLASALNALHRNGFFHYDLKTDNVMHENGKVWLIDFGLCSPFPHQHQYEACTVHCRPPELLYCGDDPASWVFFNKKVDVWSLGCIAAELILGRKAFCTDSGHTPENVLHSIFSCLSRPSDDTINYITMGKPVIPIPTEKSGCLLHPRFNGTAYDELLRGMLEVDPRRRWSTSRILRHPLFRGMTPIAFNFSKSLPSTSPAVPLSAIPPDIRDEMTELFRKAAVTLAVSREAVKVSVDIADEALRRHAGNERSARTNGEVLTLVVACACLVFKYYNPMLYNSDIVDVIAPDLGFRPLPNDLFGWERVILADNRYSIRRKPVELGEEEEQDPCIGRSVLEPFLKELVS